MKKLSLMMLALMFVLGACGDIVHIGNPDGNEPVVASPDQEAPNFEPIGTAPESRPTPSPTPELDN